MAGEVGRCGQVGRETGSGYLAAIVSKNTYKLPLYIIDLWD
jgi:hypothetical protein